MSAFRLQSNQLFLTYPQCPLSPSVALKLILPLLKEKQEWIIISQENHQDGEGLHLHAVMKCSRKLRWDFKNPRCLDLVKSGIRYHGKYERARSLYDSIKYVCKDGKVIAKGCNWNVMLKAAKEKTSTVTALIASKIMAGMTLQKINESYPGFVLQNLMKIQQYKRWLMNLEMMEEPKLDWIGCTAEDPLDLPTMMIAKWVNSNLKQEMRTLKQAQLWIWGPHSTGKTRFLETLLKYFNGWIIPVNDGNWCEGYSDKYDFCYADEFKGGKKIQWLNGFTDGSHFKLPQRGTAPLIKKVNLPVIVCCNYSIECCYSKADPIVVNALASRFLQIQIDGESRIDLKTEWDSSDEDTCPMLSDFSEEEN